MTFCCLSQQWRLDLIFLFSASFEDNEGRGRTLQHQLVTASCKATSTMRGLHIQQQRRWQPPPPISLIFLYSILLLLYCYLILFCCHGVVSSELQILKRSLNVWRWCFKVEDNNGWVEFMYFGSGLHFHSASIFDRFWSNFYFSMIIGLVWLFWRYKFTGINLYILLWCGYSKSTFTFELILYFILLLQSHHRKKTYHRNINTNIMCICNNHLWMTIFQENIHFWFI